MKKFLVSLLAAAVIIGATTASKAAILFDYEVTVNGIGPLIPVTFTQSSGASGKLDVTGLAGVNFDASGIGSDIDIADVVATQTPSSTAFSVFNGSTSTYTFTIKITDLASMMSGTFTVKGFVHGQFRELPGAQYQLGNTYLPGFDPNDSPPIQIGNHFYKLDFPAFGSDFDTPAPDGSWTFNVRAAVPEPGSVTMLIGAAVCGTLFLPRRLRRSRR